MSTLLRLITRRFFTTFVCVFLFVDGVAWFRHAVEYTGHLRFLSADFLPFSLIIFTAALPFVLLLSALILLLRMQASKEMEMLRTFAVRGTTVVGLLSHCFKVVFVLLVLSRETIVPRLQWDILRVLQPDRTERVHAIVMKMDGKNISAKVGGNYHILQECCVWHGQDCQTFPDLRWHSGHWLKKDGSAVSLPSPSAMALSNPNSLEFLSAAELASLAAGSPLRKRHLTALLLERFSSPIFFYLLALLFCRMFIRRDRNFFHVVITPVLFILSAYLTTFVVRYVCEDLRVAWVQVLAAFGPSLILVLLMASGRFRHPRKKN